MPPIVINVKNKIFYRDVAEQISKSRLAIFECLNAWLSFYYHSKGAGIGLQKNSSASLRLNEMTEEIFCITSFKDGAEQSF
jgi:hypothetical protein